MTLKAYAYQLTLKVYTCQLTRLYTLRWKWHLLLSSHINLINYKVKILFQNYWVSYLKFETRAVLNEKVCCTFTQTTKMVKCACTTDIPNITLYNIQNHTHWQMASTIKIYQMYAMLKFVACMLSQYLSHILYHNFPHYTFTCQNVIYASMIQPYIVYYKYYLYDDLILQELHLHNLHIIHKQIMYV